MDLGGCEGICLLCSYTGTACGAARRYDALDSSFACWIRWRRGPSAPEHARGRADGGELVGGEPAGARALYLRDAAPASWRVRPGGDISSRAGVSMAAMGRKVVCEDSSGRLLQRAVHRLLSA